MVGSVCGLASAVGLFCWAMLWEPGASPAAELSEEVMTQPADLSAEEPSPVLTADDPIVVRPIFFPSRRSWQAPIATTPQPPAPELTLVEEPNFVVEGVVMGKKLNRVLLRRADAKESQSLEIGQSMDDWTISAISASGVILEKGERRLEVPIYPKDNAVEFQNER